MMDLKECLCLGSCLVGGVALGNQSGSDDKWQPVSPTLVSILVSPYAVAWPQSHRAVRKQSHKRTCEREPDMGLFMESVVRPAGAGIE